MEIFEGENEEKIIYETPHTINFNVLFGTIGISGSQECTKILLYILEQTIANINQCLESGDCRKIWAQMILPNNFFKNSFYVFFNCF